MKFFSTHQISGAGHVKTTSRLRMWWLAYVRGYVIENVFQHPYQAMWGQMRLSRTWVLRRPASR